MRVLRNSTFAIVFAALTLSAHPFHIATHAQAQTSKPAQAAEEGYTFDNRSPAYALGTGPRIAVHRYVSPYVQRGAFNPFQTLVETDGFQFNWLDKQISSEALAEIDILVVSNAYTKGGANDYNNFGTLDAPSVYSPDEIQLIKAWVEQGGRLLVLADHSPFAGGAIKLAEAAAQRGAEAKLDLLFTLLDLLLVRLARTGATGAPPAQAACPDEIAVLQRLSPSPAQGRAWADAAQQISERARHGLAVNLDPAALVLDTLRQIGQTAPR